MVECSAGAATAHAGEHSGADDGAGAEACGEARRAGSGEGAREGEGVGWRQPAKRAHDRLLHAVLPERGAQERMMLGRETSRMAPASAHVRAAGGMGMVLLCFLAHARMGDGQLLTAAELEAVRRTHCKNGTLSMTSVCNTTFLPVTSCKKIQKKSPNLIST